MSCAASVGIEQNPYTSRASVSIAIIFACRPRAFVAEVARFDDVRLVHTNDDDDILARVHLAIAQNGLLTSGNSRSAGYADRCSRTAVGTEHPAASELERPNYGHLTP